MFLITTIGKAAGGTRVTDDLIDRLRGLLEEGGQIIKDQADEIERLRADLENLRDMNEQLTEELQTYYSEDELNADWE